MPTPPAAARDSLVDVLLEFFEALVHQVLFVRELYSAELFERQRLYGIAVRRARHPDLAAYVSDAVAGLRVRRLGRRGCWAWRRLACAGALRRRLAGKQPRLAAGTQLGRLIGAARAPAPTCRARSRLARSPRWLSWCCAPPTARLSSDLCWSRG